MNAGRPLIIFRIGRCILNQCCVLVADDRIVLVANCGSSGIDPDVLREFELSDQAGAADEGGDAPFRAVFGCSFRQRLTVSPAAANHSALVHVGRRVARIHAADVSAERHGVAMRVHLLVVEVVVPLPIGAEGGIVMLRRQDQRSAASPPPHQLGGDQLLFVRRVSMLAQEIAELSDVLFEAAICDIAAVPA